MNTSNDSASINHHRIAMGNMQVALSVQSAGCRFNQRSVIKTNIVWKFNDIVHGNRLFRDFCIFCKYPLVLKTYGLQMVAHICMPFFTRYTLSAADGRRYGDTVSDFPSFLPRIFSHMYDCSRTFMP